MTTSQPPFGVTRRRLMGGIAAVTMATPANALFGTPVFGQEASPAATPTGSYAPITGIERDEFIIGVQALPATLDPAQELSNVGSRVNWTPYDTLIRRDFLNGNAYVPHLATSWTQASETEIDLTLRQGVTFHNGDPFTADDVVFTFERLFTATEESNLVEAGTYFSTVESVTRVDDYTVRITTKAPDPIIVNRLASWGGWILPKKYIETVGQDEFQRTGMGTGPYRFASFTPDTEIVLERYDDHWAEPGNARRIVFRVIPEVAARVTALANNEVHLITNIPPDQVEPLQSQDAVEIRKVVLSNSHVLVYNTNNAPLNDKTFRQALNLGIDRQLLIDALWGGEARAKHGHQLEEYGALYNPDRPLLAYDKERARKLVEESSYNGEVIPYQGKAGYYTLTEQVAQAIVQMWQDIGINAEVALSDDDKTGKDRMVHTWSNSSILADPDGILYRSWGPESGTQAKYWNAPDAYNTLGVEARSTLDEQVRYDNYQNMLDIWEDDAPGTALFDPAEFYAVRKGVNWTPYPLYNMDLRAYNLSFSEDSQG